MSNTASVKKLVHCEEYIPVSPLMDTKLINLRGLSQNRIFGPLPPPSLQMEQNSSTYDGLS